MNYEREQSFLRRSRLLGLLAGALVLAAAAAALRAAPPGKALTIAVALIALALAASLFYSPDYLHFTVNPEKRPRWQLKIRWRVLAAALVLGSLLVPNLRGGLILLAALAWLAAANLLGRLAVPARWFAAYFWTTDFLLLAALLLLAHLDLLLAAALVAAAAHLSIVIADRNPLPWAGAVLAWSWLLLLAAGLERGMPWPGWLPPAGLAFIAVLGTVALVARVQRHHAANIAAALRELADFTGYDAARIRHLWATSNQELARAWQQAAIPDTDRERMAAWYRDHSELYLFAISAYNLEYKRLRSNLRALALARGACLDYGAGDGELIVELARRGHPAAYFDVDGVTKKFARYRSQRLGLAVDFSSSKEDLAQAGRARRFDTIFSFDVLEHIPDLAGELDFLASLLAPGGLFAFDVPAGSTRSHPMHLNHALDVRAHLGARGMQDARSRPARLFAKRDQHRFRAPVI